MAAPNNNRRLTIMLAIGGIAIALFAAYSLLSGGGDGSNKGSTLAPPAEQTADSGGHGGTAVTPSTTAPGEPTIPDGEFDTTAIRNPFEPAIVIEPARSGDVTPTEGTSPIEPTTPTNETNTTPTTPVTAAPSQDPATGTSVAVVDVFDQAGTTVAVVQVGSTQYTVAAGQVFATSYKVVALSGTCGQFMYGDSPFSLCKGEEVRK